MNTNPWIIHLKTFKIKYPHLSHKEAMIEAKHTFKKTKKGSSINPMLALSIGTLGLPALGALYGLYKMDKYNPVHKLTN